MKKNYYEIIKKVEDLSNDDFEIELIKDCITHFNEYVQLITTEESRIKVAKFRLELKDFQKFVSTLDVERRTKHNECISDLNVLNKLCKDYKVCDTFVNTELPRDILADEIKNIVSDIFDNRKR